MKRKPPTPWSVADLHRLRKLADQGMSTPEIASAMGRCQRSVRRAAAWYGIPLNVIRPRIRWTPEMDDVVRAHFADTRTEDFAAQMGVSAPALNGRAYKLGIRKSDAYLATRKSGRIQPGEAIGESTQFKPGLVPWNKGIKGSSGHHPNSVRTQFKPGELCGQAVHNYKPVGSLRISKDGQLERKVRDDGPSQYRWEAVARLVWEAAHGPIPPRHVVRFKPGMNTTEEHLITIDKLECISMQENLRRNSRHENYGPEMNQLMQLRGAMTRRINNLEKKINEQHDR
ncbi:MAG: HNH endonuclease [Lysobacteraceae bacterium]